MRKSTYFLQWAILAVIGGLNACSSALADKALPKTVRLTTTNSPDVKQIASANTNFGFKLLRQLTEKQPDGNVFISPFSISNALTMTMNGAGGQTERDMRTTLALGALSLEQINNANAALLPSLTHPDPKLEISVASALWARHGMTFAPDFQERCRQFYNAQATTLNFASTSAAATINGWVAKHTQGKISQLVTEAQVSSSDAILTNAVYFHGLWSTPFDKSETENAVFTLSNGTAKKIPMMQQEGRYSYLETPTFQAVSLPYGKARISLYVFLPKQGNSVDAFASSFTASRWESWLNTMKLTRLTLFLPRFKADYNASLKDPLSSLGMGSAFGPGADFRPMGLNGGFISDVIHKSILDVDEQGTTAAAATAVIMTRGVRLPPSTTLRVDHPFFCAIRDSVTGTILFEGIIRDPK